HRKDLVSPRQESDYRTGRRLPPAHGAHPGDRRRRQRVAVKIDAEPLACWGRYPCPPSYGPATEGHSGDKADQPPTCPGLPHDFTLATVTSPFASPHTNPSSEGKPSPSLLAASFLASTRTCSLAELIHLLTNQPVFPLSMQPRYPRRKASD